MTEETKEKIVSRIMKLMELGRVENNTNPHERKAAMDKAAQLMAEYSIDFAQLRAGKPSDSVFVTFKVDGSMDEKVDYEAALGATIAGAFDCRLINSWNTGVWQLHFCGTKHDLEIVVYFFKYLRRTLYAMAAKNVNRDTIDRHMRRRITDAYIEEARRNYCYGMVGTISERLKELYAKREEFIPTDCRALVVVKKEGLDKYYREQYPAARPSRTRSLVGDMSAFYKGKTDGATVNLSRPIANNGHGTSAQIT